MVELGQLEAHHEKLTSGNAHILVVSSDGRDDAEKTQKDFPHLVVVADEGHNLISTVEIVSQVANPTGKDIAAPTTMLIDNQGMVRWLFRPDRYIVRLSPAELAEAMDKYLPAK